MAKIVDPDDLLRDYDVEYNTLTKKITVRSGNTIDSKDGVTLKCVYSFTKEEWKNDPTLIPFDFPFVPITDEQFELVNGWDFANDASRYLIRDGGWAVVDPTTGLPSQKWTGIVSLGSIDPYHQPYYQQFDGAPAFDFQTQGVINQPLQVFYDADADGVQDLYDFDFTAFLSLFVRQQGWLYDKATLDDIGVTAMAYQAYRFPLADALDLNIAASDADITGDVGAPYTRILLKYFSTAYSRPVDVPSPLRNFGIVVDVGTHSGVDGSTAADGSVLTTAEGGIPGAGNTFVGGTLKIHGGANAGTYTIANVTATTVDIYPEVFPSPYPETNQDFVLQRATPYVATKQQIYEKVQYLLRQAGDIDGISGAAVVGRTADELAEFVGSTLKMGSKLPVNPKGASLGGVIIEGFDPNDTNELQFYDNSGTARTYPFVAAGTIAFNTNLQPDPYPDAAYWMFYDYTERFTNAGFDLSGTVGDVATLESALTNLVTELAIGDYIRMSGWTEAGNNGIWRVTGYTAGAGPWTVEITKVDGKTPADEDGAYLQVTLDKNPIDTPDAIVVNDNDGNPIQGAITGPSATFTFDYDNNAQGGRTPVTNAAIVIRAIGLSVAQFVETSGTISRATGLSFSLVAPLERNYANP